MALKPRNVAWIGFSQEQGEPLDFLDFVGNNGWARNGQTDELMPNLLAEMANSGLSMGQSKEAMRSIGYHRGDSHMLDRWESKRTTGRFGR